MKSLMQKAAEKLAPIGPEGHDCKFVALLLEAEHVIWRAQNAINDGWLDEMQRAILQYKEKRALLLRSLAQ